MRKFIQQYRSNVACYSLQLAILTFLFGLHTVTNVLVIACAAVWLFDEHIITKLKTAFSNFCVWLFISYFVITLVGFTYSEDLDVAGKFLEMRLVILLLPMVISTLSLNSEQSKRILYSFAYGVVLALIFGIIHSAYLYQTTGDSGFFFNDNLTLLLGNKAAYFAIYVNISIVVLLFNLKNNTRHVIPYVPIVLLIVFQFLLATRISILTLFLILIVAFLYVIQNYGKKIIASIVIGLILLFSLSIYLMPQTLKRFESMFSNFEYKFDNPNEVNHFNASEISEENWNGLTLRLALWDCGIRVIKENFWFGVGTGDYDQKFRDKIEEVNFVYAKKMDFGVHNQYLYTGISFGLLGLLIFLTSIVVPGFRAFKAGNYLFVGVLFIFSISFLTENVLNRYLGVFPFALLSTLLFFNNERNQD